MYGTLGVPHGSQVIIGIIAYLGVYNMITCECFSFALNHSFSSRNYYMYIENILLYILHFMLGDIYRAGVLGKYLVPAKKRIRCFL
jgi:membrane-bound acyltransferase YfiQ involved in biofilm formation